MRLLTRYLQDDHNLFLFGDDHEGTVLRSKKGWNKLLDMMNSSYDGLPSDRNWGIHHGDILEGIMVDDRRYDPRVIPEGSTVPMEQADNAEKNLEPIKDKLLVILESTHPWTLKRFGLLTKRVCEQLSVQYGTWTTKLSIRTTNKERLMYKSYHTHGKKSITSTADSPKRRRENMELILQRHLKFKMGDCILMCKGHTHKLLCCEPERELIIVGEDKLQADYTGVEEAYYIPPDSRYYVNTGSFQILYGENISGYAEIAEYDPIEIGFAVARVRDCKMVGVDLIPLKI